MTVPWQPAEYPLAAVERSLPLEEVHLWRIELEAHWPDADHFFANLDDSERGRAGRFRFEIHQKRFILTHGLLRHILGRYLQISAEQVRYRYGPYGKPYVIQPAEDGELQFSLSHSGAWALCAVVMDREVGVDLEQIRPVPDFQQLAERYFSVCERAALGALPSETQLEAFFRCWTCKEAYIKARGEGLSLPLDSFDVSLTPGEPAALLHSGEGTAEVRRWELRTVVPATGYLGALAVTGRGSRLVAWSIVPG